MRTFRLPDLGEGLQQAEVSEWHVRENDDVAVDQPLLSVETEKALVEIPSPRAGKIKRLLAKTGSRDRTQAVILAYDAGIVAPGV